MRPTTVTSSSFTPENSLVTSVADAIREMASRGAVELLDVLRVQDSRFWSYLCPEPSCCPAEGTPFDPAAHPASARTPVVDTARDHSSIG